MDRRYIWALRALLYKFFLGSLGSMCYLGKPIFLKRSRRIFLGKRVRIFPGSRFEVLKKNGCIVLKDNISIGHNFHIISNGELVISENTTISANVFITNTEHSYEAINIHIMDQPMKDLKTEIGPNCFIGYGACIQAGTSLGKQCVVGANSVVRGVFPDYSIIVGAPARIVKRYNEKRMQWEKTNAIGEFLNN